MPDPMRVLYVTSDGSHAERLARALEREDERTVVVEAATSAREGCDRIDADGFDAVVSGADLPDGSGLEFLETVRKRHPDLPRMLFTATCSRALVGEALAAGVTDYVPREPSRESFSLLAERLLEAVSHHRAAARTAELERVATVVRELNRALVRASTRAEIDRRVCELISRSEPYLFAWIGDHDPDSQTVTSRAAAGLEDGYLEEITITTDGTETGRGPTGEAVRTHTIQVLQNIPDDPAYEPWREQALERGYRSSAAIPLVYEGALYGVLNVYADRRWAFGERERALLAELGETIAYALDDVRVREELARTRRAIEQAADAIFLTDVDGEIEYVNPAFEALTGYTAAEAIGRTPRILRSGDVGEAYYEAMWETILAGEIWDAEIVNATKSGERYRAEQTVAPLVDESGAIDGFVAIQRDITERTARERELRRRKAQLRVLFDQAPDGIVVHDADGVVLDVNEALVDMLGYTRAALLSMRVPDFEVGIDADLLEERWASMGVGSTHTVELEGRHRRRDGSTYPVEVWISRVQTGEDGDQFVAFVRDITEHKQRIRQLRVLDRVLRHNLRNELAIVRGYAETIDDPETSHEYAGEIVASCDRLLELVDKEREIVRTLSRRPTQTAVALGEVVDRLLESARAAHPDARITVGRPDGALRVEATEHLDRAIEELLENAIVHNDRPRPSVDVTLTAADGTATVRIADDGPGIPAEEVGVLCGDNRIEPLFHGSGLGLWLVYWIVERSNGHVRFEPNEGGGSVVELTLEAAEPA